MIDRGARNGGTHGFLVDIKGGGQSEANVAELKVAHQGLAQVARAHHHNGMAPVYPQDVSDLLPQHIHIIAVALLAEFAKAEQVLPDLRGRQSHRLTQCAGRDADNPLLLQLSQMPIISGQPPNHGRGYF